MSEKRERLGSIVERDVAVDGLLEQRCLYTFFFWPILREGLAGLHLHLHLFKDIIIFMVGFVVVYF